VTTHYLDEAEHCDRIAIIQAGRLAALGTADELKQVFATRPIVEVQAARPVAAMEALDALAEIEKTSLFGTSVHAVLRSAATPVTRLVEALRAAGVEVRSVSAVAPSLEDVFLDVVERVEREQAAGRKAS
jgi:ABC-2 type transport system ATP-binding protein